MVHFLKDLESYRYNREKIVKLIPIDDLASHFLFLTKVDDHTFEARYESFAPIGSRDNVILIDIESQTFAHQGKVGDAVDLFKLLCEKGDFFTFIKKNYGINIKQYIQYIKFNDGTMIEIKEYPIKRYETVHKGLGIEQLSMIYQRVIEPRCSIDYLGLQDL